MKRALVIQHVDMEGPERIGELCQERGMEVEICRAFEGVAVPTSIAADEILVVMGGGMGVGDRDDGRFPFLNTEIALLQSAIRDERGVLGVCLGAQLLAHAAGAPVYPNYLRDADGGRVAVKEVGWGQVDLLHDEEEPALAGLGKNCSALHWHGDTFDLPDGAVHLASTPMCRHQAFRLGSRIFGLQFHVEADGPTAERWAVEDDVFVRAARGPDGPALVIAETRRHATNARAAGDRMIRNIIGCMTR